MREIFLFWFFVVIFIIILTSVSNKKNDKKRRDSNQIINNVAVHYHTNELKKQNIHQKEIELEKRRSEGVVFRKLYDLPEDYGLNYDYYDELGIISSTGLDVTPHEAEITRKMVGRYFDRRCVFLDSYLKTRNGRFAQIDIVAVNRKGVFVIESKDYSGWIFGNGNQQMWTQCFYKDKYRFYNPIRQNYGHIQCLKEKIRKSGLNYYSIVVFGNDAELKNISSVPKNTFIATTWKVTDMMDDIMREQKDCLNAHEIIDVCKLINLNRVEPTKDVVKNHIEAIKNITGKDRIYS